MISSPPPLTSPEKSPAAAVSVRVLLMPMRPDPDRVVIEVPEAVICEMSKTPSSTTPAESEIEPEPPRTRWPPVSMVVTPV